MVNKREPSCQVCLHAERGRIEALRLAGMSLRDLERRFDVNKDSVSRHVKLHMSAERKTALLVGPAKIEELIAKASEESKTQLEYLGIVRSLVFNQLLNAAEAGDFSAVARITTALTGVLKDLGHLTGELRQASGTTIHNQTNVAIFGNPEFQRLQEFLLRLARQYPQARNDIISFLRSSETPMLPVNGHDQIQAAGLQIEGTANAA